MWPLSRFHYVKLQDKSSSAPLKIVRCCAGRWRVCFSLSSGRSSPPITINRNNEGGRWPWEKWKQSSTERSIRWQKFKLDGCRWFNPFNIDTTKKSGIEAKTPQVLICITVAKKPELDSRSMEHVSFFFWSNPKITLFNYKNSRLNFRMQLTKGINRSTYAYSSFLNSGFSYPALSLSATLSYP